MNSNIAINVTGVSRPTKALVASIIKRALADAGFTSVNYAQGNFCGISLTEQEINDELFKGDNKQLQVGIEIHDKYPDLVLRKPTTGRFKDFRHHVLRDEVHDFADK